MSQAALTEQLCKGWSEGCRGEDGQDESREALVSSAPHSRKAGSPGPCPSGQHSALLPRPSPVSAVAPPVWSLGGRNHQGERGLSLHSSRGQRWPEQTRGQVGSLDRSASGFPVSMETCSRAVELTPGHRNANNSSMLYRGWLSRHR